MAPSGATPRARVRELPRLAAGRALRWVSAQLWRATGRAGHNRDELYGGAAGLRIILFHLTPREKLDTVKRVVEWWARRWPMATPADVDDLVAGRAGSWRRDRLLVTFDDGLASQYDAAVWLAEKGVRAVFFVIPSFVDRTIAEYLRYHAERGVRAYPPVAEGGVRGLSTGQLREIAAMGHRIGAHNDAHHDMGCVHAPEELRREIGEALARVADLTGAPCRDFAIAFGQPENLSPEAARYLRQGCARVFMAHRGLNVPGRTPLFLLRHAHAVEHSMAFTRSCLEGGADHRLVDRMLATQALSGLLPVREGAPAAGEHREAPGPGPRRNPRRKAAIARVEHANHR